MRRKIRMRGAALAAGRAVKPGDEVVGYEHDLKPLVDCGSAEWADLPPAPEEPAPKKKAPAKKKAVNDG